MLVDLLGCCWLIYAVSTSGAFVVGSQYGPWINIYQSTLDLVQHGESVSVSEVFGRSRKCCLVKPE